MMSEELPPVDLLDVAQQAVALQASARSVLVRCTAGTDNGTELAHEGRRVSSGFNRLRLYLDDLDGGRDHDELDQLLNHHLQMVDQALGLAYRSTPCRPDTRARFADLGAPSEHLVDLRNRLLDDAIRRWDLADRG